MAKPKFDPSKPFAPTVEGAKPRFDASKPFESAKDEFPSRAMEGRVPSFPGSEQDLAERKASKPLSEAPQEGFLDEAKRLAGSAVGTAAKGIAGGAEFLASGATGLAGSAANIVNAITGAKDLIKQPGETDEQLYRRTREGATYQPRSEGGKEIASSAIPKAIGKGVEKVGEVSSELTGDPAAGELVKDALGVGMAMVPGMRGGKPKVGAVAEGPVKTKISETPVESMRAAGLDLPPSAVRGVRPDKNNFVTAALEGIAGSEALNNSLSLKHQPKLTRFALDEIGAPKEAKALTAGVFGAARQPHLAVYRRAGTAVGEFVPSPEYHAAIDGIASQEGLSPKARATIRRDIEQYRYEKASGPDVVKTISALRSKARKASKSEDVDMADRGKAYKQAADALEEEFDRQLGDDSLVTELKNSREALAKIHDVEESTKAGQIDAVELKRRRDSGAKLSGKLALIADAAEHAPSVTRHSTTVARPSLESMSSLISPTLDLATAGLRPALRKFLESDLYQNSLGKQAENIGYGEGLSDYFNPPRTPPESPISLGEPPTGGGSIPPVPGDVLTAMEVQRRGGNELTLAEDSGVELPPVPDALSAETPPAARGDIPFRASTPRAADIAPDFGFAPGPEGSLPGGQSPRAAQLSDLVPGTMDEAAINAGPFGRVGGNRMAEDALDFELSDPGQYQPFQAGEQFRDPGALGQFLSPDQMREAGQYLQEPNGLTLADDIVLPDSQPPSPSAPPSAPDGPIGNPGLDLAADLGIEIVPSANARGGFEVSINGKTGGPAFLTEAEARAAALDIADSLVGGDEEPAQVVPLRRAPKQEGNGALPQNAFDELFANGLESIDLPSELDLGEHTIQTKGGTVTAYDIGNAFQVKRADVDAGKRGKGVGTSMYKELFAQAEAQGKTVVSDVTVSESAAKVYNRLEREGYKIKRNPAEINPKTGNWVSTDIDVPVFEIVSAPRKKAVGE